MGNDSSVLSDYEIREIPYTQLGQWTLHFGTKKNKENEEVTVFMGKLKSYGLLTQEFDRSFECLKTIRHPTILRYLNSCIVGDCAYLFVEYVLPLNQVLGEQTELEICCGLQNILIAVDFIHSKANIVHNNICKEAVFVTKTGQWKLGYFDCSCRFDEVSPKFLEQIRSLRYDKSVTPEDEGKGKLLREHVSSRDLYGYGQLVKETIGKCVESSVSNSAVFSELASKQMQNSNPELRGVAITLSQHSFFDQPLLHAQKFLMEIPVKTAADKETFFKNLPPLLYSVPEEVVSKLANVLLSRMVVLNPAAQQHLLPHLLIPRSDSTRGLFSVSNYRRFIVPVIVHIFFVRDAQIRLLLLHYFPYYLQLIEEDVLVQKLLPELLLGIKDTDDNVVSATLRALADLVPHLGSSIVIGGARLKVFTNGAPKTVINTASASASASASTETAQVGVKTLITALGASALTSGVVGALPERLEPDGGEDGACLENSSAPAVTRDGLDDDTEERWSDWETEDPPSLKATRDTAASLVIEETIPSQPSVKKRTSSVENDLLALEIQVKAKEEEIDYFADMEPTITTNVFATKDVQAVEGDVNRFNFSVQAQEEDAEAGNDGWNWDD